MISYLTIILIQPKDNDYNKNSDHILSPNEIFKYEIEWVLLF